MIPSAIIALGPEPTSSIRPIPLPVIIKDIRIRIQDKINISSRNRKKLGRACYFYRRRLIICSYMDISYVDFYGITHFGER
jgi:hypothetical protein